MKDYLSLAKDIMSNGVPKLGRNDNMTLSLVGPQLKIDLKDGFPLLTTKKIFWNGVISELLWFIEGSTNERRLAEIQFGDKAKNLVDKNTIWTANADEQGKALGYANNDYVKELGPVYGSQWRNWRSQDINTISIDQLQNAIDDLKHNPHSRRIIVNSWRVDKIKDMALPPCHLMYQLFGQPLTYEDREEIVNRRNCEEMIHDFNNFKINLRDPYRNFNRLDFSEFDNKWGLTNRKTLHCKMYQRSADYFLGVPFNIASYSALMYMIAHLNDMELGTLTLTFGDAHIYYDHFDAIDKQLRRKPDELCKLVIDTDKQYNSIDDFKKEDLKIINYNNQGLIKANMAV